MSKITVTTIAGQTSGSDANKVKIESGDELNVVNGDLTVDTDTLFVDASADKVGINQASPTYQLSVLGATQSTVEIESASTTGESRLYMTDPDSTGVGEIGYYHNGDTMRFNTGGAERMRLSSAGLHIGGTGAANALDDYEEGTWTPYYTSQHGNLSLNGNASNTSSMYQSQGGSYIKIGKKVICHMTLSTTGVTSFGGSGNLWVAGLPFTNATTTASKPRGVNGCMGGRFNSFTPEYLVVNSNATTFQIRNGFESYPDINKLDTGGSGNRNVIEALIVYEIA